MTIDEIRNGIVLDHIRAGTSLELYKALNLESLDCSVAILKNVPSKRLAGRKDIIKIDTLIDLNLDVIGYMDPGITVNIVKDGQIVRKSHPELPLKILDVIRCKNPRCISSTEQELPQIFELTDKDEGVYRCVYCEAQAGENN